MISYYGIVTLFNILYVCIAQVHAPVVDVCCTWPWCPRFATEPDGPLGFPGLYRWSCGSGSPWPGRPDATESLFWDRSS